MDDAVAAYIDAIPAGHRPMFDRIHGLILEEFPDAAVVISYDIPTYKVAGLRLFVGAWSHGISIYGWKGSGDGGFTDRHPEVMSGRATIRLRPEAAAAIPDEEFRALVRATLGG